MGLKWNVVTISGVIVPVTILNNIAVLGFSDIVRTTFGCEIDVRSKYGCEVEHGDNIR